MSTFPNYFTSYATFTPEKGFLLKPKELLNPEFQNFIQKKENKICETVIEDMKQATDVHVLIGLFCFGLKIITYRSARNINDKGKYFKKLFELMYGRINDILSLATKVDKQYLAKEIEPIYHAHDKVYMRRYCKTPEANYTELQFFRVYTHTYTMYYVDWKIQEDQVFMKHLDTIQNALKQVRVEAKMSDEAAIDAIIYAKTDFPTLHKISGCKNIKVTGLRSFSNTIYPLENYGNTCYFNSARQLLYTIPFDNCMDEDAFMKIDKKMFKWIEDHVLRNEIYGQQQDCGDVINRIREFQSYDSNIDAVNLVNKVKHCILDHYRFFLGDYYLYDKKAIRRVNRSYYYKNTSEDDVTLCTLSLPRPHTQDTVTIVDALKLYFEEQEEDHHFRFDGTDYTFVDEHEPWDITDKSLLTKFAHLISFPECFIFTLPPIHHSGKKLGNIMVDECFCIDGKYYVCVSIIVHGGGAKGGHYVAYSLRMKDNKPTWFLFNDDDVKEIGIHVQDVVRDYSKQKRYPMTFLYKLEKVPEFISSEKGPESISSESEPEPEPEPNPSRQAIFEPEPNRSHKPTSNEINNYKKNIAFTHVSWKVSVDNYNWCYEATKFDKGVFGYPLHDSCATFARQHVSVVNAVHELTDNTVHLILDKLIGMYDKNDWCQFVDSQWIENRKDAMIKGYKLSTSSTKHIEEFIRMSNGKKTRYIFLPINTSAHWILGIWHLQGNRIHIYDSFSYHDRAKEILEKGLLAMMKPKYKKKIEVHVMVTTKQTNGIDCALHMLGNVEAFLRSGCDLHFCTITPSQAAEKRREYFDTFILEQLEVVEKQKADGKSFFYALQSALGLKSLDELFEDVLFPVLEAPVSLFDHNNYKKPIHDFIFSPEGEKWKPEMNWEKYRSMMETAIDSDRAFSKIVQEFKKGMLTTDLDFGADERMVLVAALALLRKGICLFIKHPSDRLDCPGMQVYDLHYKKPFIEFSMSKTRLKRAQLLEKMSNKLLLKYGITHAIVLHCDEKGHYDLVRFVMDSKRTTAIPYLFSLRPVYFDLLKKDEHVFQLLGDSGDNNKRPFATGFHERPYQTQKEVVEVDI